MSFNKSRLFAALGLLALAAAPVAYAADPQAPASAGATSADDIGFAFSGESVVVEQQGALLRLAGGVRLDVPASTDVAYSCVNVTVQPSGEQVLFGAVELTIGRSHILTERAVLTRAADGSAVITMDQAQIVRQH